MEIALSYLHIIFNINRPVIFSSHCMTYQPLMSSTLYQPLIKIQVQIKCGQRFKKEQENIHHHQAQY